MSEVEIRRSTRRKRTVRAYREGDKTIVLVPAHLSVEEEQRHVRSLVERLDRREKATRPSDTELLDRATELSVITPDPSNPTWQGITYIPSSPTLSSYTAECTVGNIGGTGSVNLILGQPVFLFPSYYLAGCSVLINSTGVTLKIGTTTYTWSLAIDGTSAKVRWEACRSGTLPGITVTPEAGGAAQKIDAKVSPFEVTETTKAPLDPSASFRGRFLFYREGDPDGASLGGIFPPGYPLRQAAIIVKEVPGRPTLWATTPEFLVQFGLSGLRDLPRREDLLVEPPGPAPFES